MVLFVVIVNVMTNHNHIFDLMNGFISETFDHLLEEVGSDLESQGSTNGKSLLPSEKILIFLFFLAGNSLYRVKNYAHDIGYSTIFNAIRSCIDVFYDHFVEKYIKLPTEEQASHEADLFHSSSGFPKVIWGALGKFTWVLKLSIVNEMITLDTFFVFQMALI